MAGNFLCVENHLGGMPCGSDEDIRDFAYIYDYGNEWIHRVEVIDFDYAGLPPRRKLYCLEAKGACPPEIFSSAR